MAKNREKSFYNSKAWAKCRRVYLSEHPYCEKCSSIGKIVPAERVHHKIWLTKENIDSPTVTLCYKNLEVLYHD